MTSIHEFALDATRKFLQSVVFVDDEIYTPVSEFLDTRIEIPTEMTIFKHKASATESNSGIERDDTAIPDDEILTFHPKQLVESFAKERIVCALYEPKQGFSSAMDSEIFRLCERADAAILDWDLFNDDGRSILPLITGLVSQSSTTVPHHVRLCAVYTAKPDLEKVTSQIYDHLNKFHLPVNVSEKLKLTAGSSRIIVLGKPSTMRSTEQRDEAEVAESDLADRVIKEFAAMHEGILPSVALHGMAAVRSNTKRILDKFHSDMDGAFLVHRGLLLPVDDPFEELPELLVEEALAVMNDQRIPLEDTDILCKETIDAADIQLTLNNKGNNNNHIPGKIAKDLLKHGVESVKADFDPAKAKNKKWIDELHGEIALPEARMRLAALYNTRTQYSDHRNLVFGTVVRENNDGDAKYSVCLMPLCDSLRLSNENDKVYRFPFWSLKHSNSGASARGVVVELPEGGFIELYIMGKPRDQLWIGKFKAGDTGTVTAVAMDGKYNFESQGSKSDLIWVAQLKPNHIQRIAQDVGASFMRVGVIEAEWLRLKSE